MNARHNQFYIITIDFFSWGGGGGELKFSFDVPFGHLWPWVILSDD